MGTVRSRHYTMFLMYHLDFIYFNLFILVDVITLSDEEEIIGETNL